MIRAEYKDRNRIINILAKSFDDNKSVNYIIKQDKKRVERMKKLMEYSFEVCYLFGDVFLTDDKKGCALILLPDKKRITLRSILLDVKLVIACVSLSNIKKALNRESRIKKIHPKGLMYYLWFIGVDPTEQNSGVGSDLMKDIIQQSAYLKRSIYLETSTLKNIPWYERFGFKTYNKLDLGYELIFMSNA